MDPWIPVTILNVLVLILGVLIYCKCLRPKPEPEIVSTPHFEVAQVRKEGLFYDCEDTFGYRNVDYIREEFLRYFPRVQLGESYNFDELPEDLQKEVIDTFEFSFWYGLPGMVDLSLECFGKLVPLPKGSWTQYCCVDGNLKVLKRLHELGLELDAINNVPEGSFYTFPLIIAAEKPYRLELVPYLLEKGADLSVRDPKTNETALECAYNNNNLEAARLLANQHVNMPLRSDFDKILDLARHENKTQFIKLFEEFLKNEK